MKKGQNFRCFIDDKCVAAAKTCSFEEAAELEDISTKDSTGSAKQNSTKGKSWNDYGIDHYSVTASAVLGDWTVPCTYQSLNYTIYTNIQD